MFFLSFFHFSLVKYPPPKFDMKPKKIMVSKKDSQIPGAYFQVPCFAESFLVAKALAAMMEKNQSITTLLLASQIQKFEHSLMPWNPCHGFLKDSWIRPCIYVYTYIYM